MNFYFNNKDEDSSTYIPVYNVIDP